MHVSMYVQCVWVHWHKTCERDTNLKAMLICSQYKIVVQHCVNGDFPVESLETINTQQIQQNTAITQLKLLSGCFSVARSMVHII